MEVIMEVLCGVSGCQVASEGVGVSGVCLWMGNHQKVTRLATMHGMALEEAVLDHEIGGGKGLPQLLILAFYQSRLTPVMWLPE